VIGDALLISLAASFRAEPNGARRRQLMINMAEIQADGLAGATIQAELADHVEGWDDAEFGRDDAALLQSKLRWSVFGALSRASALTTADCLGDMLECDNPFTLANA
jgi:hypothetical protein